MRSTTNADAPLGDLFAVTNLLVETVPPALKNQEQPTALSCTLSNLNSVVILCKGECTEHACAGVGNC